MRFKKLAALGLVSASLLAAMATPAAALEYEFGGDAPGQIFYVITSTDANYIANADSIVIGTDGIVASTPTGDYTISPLSVLDIPIGEYPDAWGESTDMAIAMNTMIPHELGPTANNSNFYKPVYTPVVMTAGLAPLYYYAPATASFGGYMAPVAMPAVTSFTGLSSAMPSTF